MSEVSPVYEEVYYVSQIGVDEAYYGKELQNGMVVLTMKSESRTSYIEGSNLNNATYDQFNRWCRVSGLTVRSSGVRFFGTYADGSQLLHFSDHYDGWYVKIDSIPVEPATVEFIQKVRDILKVDSDDCTCHRAQEIELGMMDTVEALVELFQETAGQSIEPSPSSVIFRDNRIFRVLEELVPENMRSREDINVVFNEALTKIKNILNGSPCDQKLIDFNTAARDIENFMLTEQIMSSMESSMNGPNPFFKTDKVAWKIVNYFYHGANGSR